MFLLIKFKEFVVCKIRIFLQEMLKFRPRIDLEPQSRRGRGGIAEKCEL